MWKTHSERGREKYKNMVQIIIYVFIYILVHLCIYDVYMILIGADALIYYFCVFIFYYNHITIIFP